MMSATQLTLQAYQTAASKTDVKKQFPLEFFLLGLFGEVGTLVDAVKKKQRDVRSYVGYESNVVEELGDVLWYLRVCPGTSSGITKFSEHEAD